jgi:hypothetical protein
VHPLTDLPYTDTANFSAPGAVRFNRLDAFMAARILFGTGSKLEGDLKRVEVDLRCGTRVLTTRLVDFDDKHTVNDAKGDSQLFVDDIGVEGYQKSDMVKHGRADLAYGILVRKIPRRCDTLVARVFDVGANVVTSSSIAVPDQTAVDEFIDFEDGQLPPGGWTKVTSADGSGTEVSIEAAAAHSGTRACGASTTRSPRRTRSAGIAYTLPSGRFEWRAQAWFSPIDLRLDPDQAIYLLYFLSGTSLSVAARIRNDGGTLRAGLVATKPGSTFVPDDAAIITARRWRRWRLELLRVATRETTTILYLNEGGRMNEQARLNWGSTDREPASLRAGNGFSSTGAAATVLLDKLWLTESELSS